MRSRAQHKLDRFLAAALAALPEGYPLPDETLREEMSQRAHPKPLVSEISNSILFMESAGRIHGLRTETGVKWTLTEIGRAWWEQNQ